MNKTARIIILVMIAAFAAMAHGQAITQLGRENMRIPFGERPEAPPPGSRDFQVQVDTTAAYYVWVDSAQHCIDRAEWSAAEHCLRQAIASEPNNVANSLLLSNLGTIQRQSGKRDEALRTYNMALDMTPNAVTLLLNRAELLLEMGRGTEAVADFERVASLDATDEVSRYSLGMIALEGGDAATARQRFEEILKFDSKSPLAHEGLGLLYKDLGEFATAVEHFTAAIGDGDTNDASLLANRADCLLVLRRLGEAATDIDQALALTPDDGFIYLLRAKLNKMRWDLDAMQRDIQLAVEHGVDKATAENLLK